MMTYIGEPPPVLLVTLEDDDGRHCSLRVREVIEVMWIPKSFATVILYRNGITTSFKDASGRLFRLTQDAMRGPIYSASGMTSADL